MIARLSRVLTVFGLILLLAACGGAAATATTPPTNTPVPATNTPVPPTNTAVPPTNTAVPPTATTVPPTNTAAPPTATSAPPTATRPAATATAARAAATPTTARPATTATRAPSSGGGTVMTDANKRCQVTLPATFAADAAGDGNATSTDGNAFLNLASFDTEPLGFEATTELFTEGFTTALDDYVEADRQTGVDRGRDFTGVTFTATLVGQPVLGQFYFVEEGPTTCAMSIVVLQSVASQYPDIIGALVDSVQAVRP